MVSLVSATLVAGSAVVAMPVAEAATYTQSSLLTVSAYERLNEKELREFYSVKPGPVNWDATFLLPTQLGPGWCIDWGVPGPWDGKPGGYDIRKLTGASGRYGEGLGINEDVRLAAINVTKSLINDYRQFEKSPNLSLQYNIKTKNRILQALLTNHLGALNEMRSEFYYGKLNKDLFRTLTGFDIAWKRQDRAGDGTPNYVLVKNENFATVQSNYRYGEYVTVLVPKNYNLNLNPKIDPTVQRIVTIVQPGLPGFNPGQTDIVYETEKNTLPAVTSTVVTTRPATKTTQYVTEPARTVTETYTHPAVTVTERSTLPTATRTTRVTTPARTVTETTKAQPLTYTTVVTESNTPVTKTVVEEQPVRTITKTVPGEPTTLTETITDTPVVVTKPATTETVTRWSTPTRTSVVDVPAAVVTSTVTETPEPVTSTRVVPVTENYYTERVYESVKEIEEYYYYAGFVQNDQSKVIEVPKNVRGEWTFDIIKGREIVDIKRTNDGKLEIKPKPGFNGEGDVEILITDGEGNQFIYRVKVSDTINVETLTNIKVNNFFYTINPGSEERITIKKNTTDKVELVWIDEKGQRHDVVPGDIEILQDEENINIEVTKPDLRGQVIVKVVEESGNVRENIVTIENTVSKFDVTREILSTSTAVIERRGGNYKVISGEDKVTVTQSEDGKTWIVKPKDKDTTGEVVIVFTDEQGIEYKYTLNIKSDVNSGPVIRNYEIQSDDSVKITRESGWKIVPLSDDFWVTETDGQWVVKPRDGFTGKAIIHVVDEKTGVLIGVWNLDVTPGRDWQNFDTEERKRNVVDRAFVDIFRGSDLTDSESGRPFVKLKFDVPEGKTPEDVYGNIVDFEKSTLLDNGDWQLRFKQGATGTVTVVEEQLMFHDNKAGEYKPITKYVYNVSQAPVREMSYSVTSDNTLDLGGTNLRLAKTGSSNPADLLAEASKFQDGASRIELDFKRDANGTLVIENCTDDGYVFERYTINVTPGREATIKPIQRDMTWNATARIPGKDDDKAEVVEGQDLVTVKRNPSGDGFTIDGVEGKTGTAKIQVKDARGVWAEYQINVTAPVKGELTYQVATNSQFRATLTRDTSFTIVDGAEYFNAPFIKDDREWVLEPKADAAGKSGVVEERDKNNKLINRYTINIIEGRSATVREQRSVIPEQGYTDIPAATNGGRFTVVAGSEFVTTETVDGTFRVTANANTAGKEIRVEERDSSSKLLRTIILEIVPVGLADSGVIGTGKYGTNVDLKDIDNRTTTGDINITFPDGIKDLIVTRGEENIDRINVTDGGVNGKLKEGADGFYYVLVDAGGQQSAERKFTVKLTQNQSETETQDGSSELTGKCIAAIAGALSPLLLLIPIGILSQVQIPGLEAVSGQINNAIREANDYIQRGLGIYDRDKAQRAAELQGAFSFEVVNPEFIGLAAGSLGIITAGLWIIDQVMHECGAGQYTSSYAVGNATGNDWVKNGSSKRERGPKTTTSAQPTTSQAAPKSNTNVSVQVNTDGKVSATTVTTK